MLDFFHTLIKPDHQDEADSERAEVAQAANLLQVGEFQILQLAYHAWHDEDLPKAMIDTIFADYMLRKKVPHWARHYAREIIDLEKQGRLYDHSPGYHRFDHDYVTYVPEGGKKFITAVSILGILLFGAIGMAAVITGGSSGSVLPPYFQDGELKKGRAVPLP
jgi:hypothetical protein